MVINISRPTQIVVFLAVSILCIGLVAAIVVISTESSYTNYPPQYLWFKFDLRQQNITTLSEYHIYQNGAEVESGLLMNETGWQQSQRLFDYNSSVDVYLHFWYIDGTVPQIHYRIGRSVVVLELPALFVNIVSDVGIPGG